MMAHITGNLNKREVYIDGKELSPKESQAIINHSPDGFNWGYGGSGPSQLSLGLLLKYTDKSTAIKLYQYFKWDIIAKLKDNFELDSKEIINWLKEQNK